VDERQERDDDTLECFGYFCFVPGGECEDDGVYDWDGCAAGLLAENLVNVESALDQRDPALAVLANGDYVVVWESQAYPGSGWEIAGRVFGTGVNYAVGAEQRGNEHADGHQINPAVAALTGGGFVVAWQGPDPDSAVFESRIFARVFDEDGQPDGESWIVSNEDEASQHDPAVAGLADGGFVVSWQHNVHPVTDGDDGWNVFIEARTYSADGNSGPVVLLTDSEEGHTDPPAVAALTGGRSMVVWAGEYDQSGLLGPFVAYLDAAGQLEGAASPFPAADNPGHYEGLDVAVFPAGTGPTSESALAEAFVVMERDNSDFGEDIYVQMLDDQGQPFWSQFKANLLDSNDPDPIAQQIPSVALLQDGTAAVVWDTYSYAFENGGEGIDIYMQVLAFSPFSPQPTPLGDTDPRVNRYVSGEQSRPDVGALQDGSFVVVWDSCPGEGYPGFAQDESGCGIFAQRFQPDGVRMEPWQQFSGQ